MTKSCAMVNIVMSKPLTNEKIKVEIRKFIESFDDVTKRLDQTVKSFEALKTTRVNKLEKSFEELDSVNKELED